MYHSSPCNAILSKLLEVCSICGLGPGLVGIHSISLAARYRVAACSTALSPLNSLRLAPSVVSVLIWVGIHSMSLAVRYRVAACSSTLRRGLEKVNEARGHKCTPLLSFLQLGNVSFFFPLLAHSTAGAFDIVCRLDRDDTLDIRVVSMLVP